MRCARSCVACAAANSERRADRAAATSSPRSLAVRLTQVEDAAKRASLAAYGGVRAPPGAAKLYDAEQARQRTPASARLLPCRSRAARRPQRITELSATVAELKRRLAREHELCAAALKQAKVRRAL